MKRTRNAAPWLAGILTASLIFAVILLFNQFLYTGSDDTPILRSFMGFEGGEPATFSMLVHPVMGRLLWGLAKLFPGVAWFSYFQLFFLWFSTVVVVKSVARCAVLHKRPLWLGIALGAATAAAGAFWITMRVSFTTTAAWLGAAAVAQLASVDWAEGKKRAVRRGLALSILLLVCCYFLRQVSVLPPLAFWLLGLLVVWLARPQAERKAVARPVLAGAAVCLAILVGLSGVRLLETRTLRLDDFYRWQEASGVLLDYSDLDHVAPTDGALAEIGWSREEYTLFTYWYFMDDNMTPEAMTQLYESTFQTPAKSAGERLTAATAAVGNAVKGTPSQTWGIVFGLLAAALCVALAAMRGFKNPFLWLGALAAPLLALLLLGYLGWEGRLPLRAMLSVTLPMLTLSVCLLTASLEPAPGARLSNALGLMLCALLLFPAARGATLAWNDSLGDVQALRKQLEINETLVAEDLDTYAAESPDTLFIYDLSGIGDNRMFPKAPDPMAGNVMFWGGYSARTPSWYRMLAGFGVTELNASVFLRDNVVLVTTDPEPWPSFMAYVSKELGEDVDWVSTDSYGVLNFFQLYAV